MKKILMLMTVAMLLVACGNDSEPAGTDEEKTAIKEVSKDTYFENGELKNSEVKVKITETKVIPVGEAGNEYGDKPVFAIWYEATNLTDESKTPIDAWIDNFSAIQDNDPNMVNNLSVGGSPDESHLDTQLNEIKKDGTVENSIAYELDDTETPVTLIVIDGFGGDEIGEEDYEIK